MSSAELMVAKEQTGYAVNLKSCWEDFWGEIVGLIEKGGAVEETYYWLHTGEYHWTTIAVEIQCNSACES